MIQSLGLKDKKVLVPRGKKEAKSFSRLLESFGGIPIEIPLIAFRPVELNVRLRQLFETLHTYDWIIFTSKVTVETLMSIIGPEKLSRLPKIAVIGKKTEDILQAKGLKAEFFPSKFVAETFVEEFLPYIQTGMKVCIPKGNLARDYITDSLKQAGAIVDEATVYETYMPEESSNKLAEMIAKDQLDILMFTSPSTVDHLMSVVKEFHLEKHLESCLIGCIGPVTEHKLISYGLTVHASPKVYTVEEMINSMNSYLLKERQC
jgi:uroporphyrinogen-III synthase